MTIFQPWLEILLWLPWSILVDYISLLKTRVILRILTRINRTDIAIGLVIVDYLIYFVLFIVGALAVGAIYMLLSDPEGLSEDLMRSGILSLIPSAIIKHSFIPPLLRQTGAVPFIAFWSGLVPSIWMWLYVLALFVTRTLLRSEKLVNWLRWALDIEKNPFRSIGVVAATLAFIASIAIILVSAEVSRMSAAS
jgi:hypothetical protein